MVLCLFAIGSQHKKAPYCYDTGTAELEAS